MSHIHPDDRGELLACLEGITKDELKEFVVIFRWITYVPGSIVVGEPGNC